MGFINAYKQAFCGFFQAWQPFAPRSKTAKTTNFADNWLIDRKMRKIGPFEDFARMNFWGGGGEFSILKTINLEAFVDLANFA